MFGVLHALIALDYDRWIVLAAGWGSARDEEWQRNQRSSLLNLCEHVRRN